MGFDVPAITSLHLPSVQETAVWHDVPVAPANFPLNVWSWLHL